MKKTELVALKKSIKKWWKIINDTRAIDNLDEDCALCQLYMYGNEGGCTNCPIDDSCSSIHGNWIDHTDSHSEDAARRKSGCDECMELATNMLMLLISKLPKKELNKMIASILKEVK